MKITNPELVDRVRTFLRGISPQHKVCILHDTDPDGICAAVIFAKCLQRLRNKKIDLRKSLLQKKLTDAMIAQIKNDNVTHLIIVDFSADQYPDELRILAKTCSILVVDHHANYTEFENKNIIIYKPQLFCNIPSSSYSTAKLAYDVVRDLVKADDLDWLAAIGLIADIATQPWTEWLNEVFYKYRIDMKEDFFETVLGKAASTINSAEVYDKKLVTICYDLFYKATRPEDIIKSKLNRYREIIQAELDKHIEKFAKEAAEYGDMLIYPMQSKYELQGPLSTLICLKYPHNTIIIINTNAHVRVSARRCDQKISAGKLMEQLVNGFHGASAGGHAKSAGARFDKKYLNEFKKRVIKCST